MAGQVRPEHEEQKEHPLGGVFRLFRGTCRNIVPFVPFVPTLDNRVGFLGFRDKYAHAREAPASVCKPQMPINPHLLSLRRTQLSGLLHIRDAEA
jgi:hypothetical protein